MCRNWFFGVCDNECHYAHRIIPSNRTCHLWLYRKNCTRQQCPFAHGRQSYNRPVRNQPPVRDSDTQHDMPRDSTPLASSGTSRSAESIAPVPLAMKACDARGPSRVASNNGLSECTRKLDGPRLKEVCRNWLDGRCKNAPCHRLHERPTDDVSSDGPRPKEVCRNWLDGRCKNAPCPHLHERPADDNASKTNSPSSSSSSSCPVVQNTHVNDPPAPRSPHPTQKTVISNSVSRNPPPGLPSPMLKTNVSSSSSSIVRNTHVDRTPAPRNPQPAQKTVISNSVSRNPPPGLPSPALKTNAPTSSSSSTVIVRNMHVGGALASRDPHPAQKTVISNSVSRNPPPGLPSPMVKANAPSSSGSSPAIVRNTHVDRASAPRNPNPAQKTVTSNSVSRNPPPGIPSPPTRRNDDFVIPVTISDHIIVKLRNGFEVQDVTTGFETRWVHIGDVSPSTKEPQIRSLLESFGQVDELFISDGKDGKRSAIKAQFSTAAQAMKASMDLQGRQFQGRRLTAKLTLNTTARGTTVLRDTTVRITWTAPQRVGYAGYATLDEAKVAIATATGFVMKDNVLTAALYEGLPAVGAYSVMFSHLPSDAERKDLEQFGNAESIVFERPNYQSPDNARQTVVRMLRSCGNLSNLDLALPIWKGTVLAWATFESHADASNARDYLDGQYPRAMGGKIYISARHVQSLNFTLPLSQFKMLEGDITRLRWSWRTRFHHDVTIADRLPSPDGPVYIRISAENLSNLGIAKAEFEQLQHGEVVTLQKKPIWDRFFAHPAGQSFLRELESRYPGIVLRTRMGKILLLGPIGQRQLARRDIMTRFEELQARHRWPIPLSGKMVGPFVGADLLTLQKSLGPENCYVQQLSNQRVLVVRGNEQAYRIACEAVEKVQSRYTNSSTPSPQSVCPVCFTEASVPTLLNCGHSWCTSCLEGYLMSAVENKTFPLTCLGDDASCTERISLLHAKKILSGDDFAALCEASFWSHVHVRTDEFHHCPTPDCAQVYRATPASAILQCPSCLVRICSGCHAEAHDGLTCEERDVAEDKLFHEWTATHDVKNCPGCKTPIERSEGCNHMTCTRCQTHICWECLATFPKGDGIYDHMRHKHGGIGLDFL
ncbi:uncharacterized protein EDB91DRAFT_466018 [Suillus paluster]|uniref:uncharacterized protein n=1 Tax=Suillus paluster TaxID=48578 RepID=UPI001B8690FC|nr:uncharacterized protein EDB91DRAFT_466018 [Suillus paluster]KAG1738129.1 hypothetical protein EDB91DRAFT_466018 [Suillus paluster]